MSSVPRECARLRERLSELAEGVLRGRARARLEHHLSSCSRCASELAQLRAVVSSLHSLSPEPMPPRLLDSVRREVARAAPPRVQPVRDWVRLAVASAAGGVVLAIALAFCFTRPELSTVRAPGRSHLGSDEVSGRQAIAPSGMPLEMAQMEPAPAGPPGTPGPSKPRDTRRPARRDRAAGNEAKEAAALPLLPPSVSDQAASGAGGAARRGPRPYERCAGTRAGKARGDAEKRPEPSRSQPDEEPTSFAVPVAEAVASEVAGPRFSMAPPPPVRARLAPAGEAGLLAIVLTPAAELTEDVVLAMDRADGRRLVLWKGRLREVTQVPIPASSLGPGPAALPLTVETKLGHRRYVLFLPLLSRLGETAPSIPGVHYEGEPLGIAFARISELGGLLLLVEAPLNRPVIDDLPAGPPDSVLSLLAAAAGLSVESHGGVLRTLARAQPD